MDSQVREVLERAAGADGLVVFLTGAGISAESGVPTFRGREGYWVVGSKNYHPQELATRSAFREMPEELWRWYLYRRGVCRAAEPNPAHRALAELERELGDGFLLVTQNVDGLHLRAGSSRQRTYEIHGNVDFLRCGGDCTPKLREVPAAFDDFDRDTPLSGEQAALLHCPECGAWARPHVLWFDEFYDEELFRFESSLAAVARARLLVTVGSTGKTSLPVHMVGLASQRGVPMIDVNPEENDLGGEVLSAGGARMAQPASEAVPELVQALVPVP